MIKPTAAFALLFAASAVFGAGKPFASFTSGASKHMPRGRFSADLWFEKRENITVEAARLRHEYTKCADAEKQPAENITVPIESYPDGSVKASIFAKRAHFFMDNGYVWGEGVRVRHFSKTGEVEAEVTASSCVVDRNSRCGWAEGHSTVTYGGTKIEGDGVYFSLKDEYIMISENTQIVSTDLKFGGLKL